MSNEIYAVIMAGGQGERFWPASRRSKPKQLLSLVSSVTMLEATLARLRGFLPLENVIIMTGAALVPAVQSLLPELPPENIIGERVGRNTAPCLAAACGIINNRTANSPAATMLVMPSDHLIDGLDKFIGTLQNILAVMAKYPQKLYTIGIKPTFPSTAYGYIKCAGVSGEAGVRPGVEFVEKPGLEVARRLVASGNYYWNGGMFFWRTEALMAEFRLHAPDLALLAEQAAAADKSGTLEKFMAEAYPKAEAISIDYAIMEKVDGFMVASGDFSWDDIGSWSALGEHLAKDEANNAVKGRFVGSNVKNCVIYNDDPEHLLSGIDLENMMIVRSGNGTLVAPLSSDQKVREIVKKLKLSDENKKFL